MHNLTAEFLTSYHLTLILGATERYMGRVNHLQILDVPSDLTNEEITHIVRFWDGENRRELLGKVCRSPQEAALTLDMGRGKIYRFRRLGRQIPDAVVQ